jgi:hypothetical protein
MLVLHLGEDLIVPYWDLMQLFLYTHKILIFIPFNTGQLLIQLLLLPFPLFLELVLQLPKPILLHQLPLFLGLQGLRLSYGWLLKYLRTIRPPVSWKADSSRGDSSPDGSEGRIARELWLKMSLGLENCRMFRSLRSYLINSMIKINKIKDC